MYTKESENYPFRQIKQMRDDSKKNSSRIHHNPDGTRNYYGGFEDDYVSETNIHPQHKEDLINILCAVVLGLGFVACLMFLVWFFEVR